MHVEYRAEFRCTPWQLWPFLDDAEKQKLWLTTLLDVVPTSQVPRAVGATFDMRVREGRRTSHYEGRLNAYDPPRHLGVSLWGGGSPRGVRGFSSRPSGSPRKTEPPCPPPFLCSNRPRPRPRLLALGGRVPARRGHAGRLPSGRSRVDHAAGKTPKMRPPIASGAPLRGFFSPPRCLFFLSHLLPG